MKARIATMVLVVAAVGAGCSSSGTKSAGTATTATTAAASTASTTSAGSASTEAPASTTSLPAGEKFFAIEGQYVAGTEDGGTLYIRGDGAARFLAPDDKSCPSCTTAASPKASIDISLQSLTDNGTGAYSASGVVSDISDVPWAASMTGGPAIGSPVTITVDQTGGAHLSFAPANDVLKHYGMEATYTNTPPCTVAAAAGPVAAAESGDKVNGVTCAKDKEWMEASVSNNGIDAVKVLQADYTDWIVVDRPTVCNGHDVPADFFTVACSTS